MKSSNQLEAKVKYFLSLKETNNTLLLNGNWGTGKTFFIKKFLKENKEYIEKQDFKYIKYINASIYDNNFNLINELIKNVEKIKKENKSYTYVNYSFLLNKEINTENNFIKSINKLVKGINKKFSTSLDFINDILKIKAEKNMNNILVIIDEIDRIRDEVSLKLIFSQIINIKENINKNISFIIILSEDNLSENNKEILNSWREKIFTHELEKFLCSSLYKDLPNIQGSFKNIIKKKKLSGRIINKYNEIKIETDRRVSQKCHKFKDEIKKNLLEIMFHYLLSYYLECKDADNNFIKKGKELANLNYNIIDEEIEAYDITKIEIDEEIKNEQEKREYISYPYSELNFINNLLSKYYKKINFYDDMFDVVNDPNVYHYSFISLINKAFIENFKNKKDLNFINKLIEERLNYEYENLSNKNINSFMNKISKILYNNFENKLYKDLAKETNIKNEIIKIKEKIIKNEINKKVINIEILKNIFSNFKEKEEYQLKNILKILIEKNKEQNIKISEIREILKNNSKMLENFEKEIKVKQNKN
tara:strand:- start:17480 stop:19087 length:1608 start_codon:yes stop_codon:yes gene_type:complete